MLQLQNNSPFVPFLNVLPDPDGVQTLQVVAKGTFSIVPEVEVAPVQVPACREDQFWADPHDSSLRVASDVHLGKPSTDVVMVGQAWSSRGPVSELLVTVAVAERRKVVRVIGDRRWRKGGTSFTGPEPFECMPLLYERAFGGVHIDDGGRVLAAEERNPVGTGFMGPTGLAGGRPSGQLAGQRLPNLEDPRSPLRRAGDWPAPAGFGFVAPSWLPRRRFAGTYDQDWARTRAPYLPRDFDRRFFNAAPPDLVFDRFLTGGERVELDGVSRRGPLRFLLPRERPQATVWMAGQILTPPLRLETVLIEPDQERVCLTWRASVPCDKSALKIRQVAITTREPEVQIGERVDAAAAALADAVEPPPPRFRMHFDADRDGKVDDNWMGLARWELGRGKRGTIVVCNNDDDDRRGVPDNRDGRVNGGNDSSELAPIVIRRHGAGTAPGSWKGSLEIAPITARRVRIFDARRGGVEVIGPGQGRRYQLPDLEFTERELGIEALFFAGEDGGWDGLVAITWLIEDDDGVVSRQTGTMRVAPWMMPSHLEPAEKVFVVDAGAFNRRFRAELATVVAGAGCALQQFRQPDDIWMQDCMEIGFTFAPKHHMPVVMRAKRDRELNVFPRTLLEPDFGYEEPAPLAGEDSTFDSNGNLEATPPVKSRDGRSFPWGRIYLGPGRGGDPFDPAVLKFLHAQEVQSPIHIDTAWLAVGHVDEIMTFVPAPTGKGFKLLLASPGLAFELLVSASAAGHGWERMLIGRDFDGRNAEVSIDDFLDSGIPGLSLSRSRLQSFNGKAVKRLAAIRDKLDQEISLDRDDLIEVPIIFMPNDVQPALADALTTGMVNMLVINQHCIVPKPFGPVVGGLDLFEEDLRTKLTRLGLSVEFIDDWAEYHVNLGEVHCATNTLRRPDPAKWKWWEANAR